MNTTMKITTLLVASALAWGQTPAGKPSATQPAGKGQTSTAPAAKKAPVAKKKTAPSAKTATAAKPKTTSAKPKVAAAKPNPMKPKPAKPVAQKAAPEMTAPAVTSVRKRDPFISPVQARIEGMAGACGGGKRCLAVGEIILRGIVRAPNGMIAVVENSARKTYFLRENDPIFNGFVQKITADSVVFREHVTDNLGRDSLREVVKTVNAPVV